MGQKTTYVYPIPQGIDCDVLADRIIGLLRANSFEWNEGSRLNNGVPFWHYLDPVNGGGMVEIDFDGNGNLVLSGFEQTIFGGETDAIGEMYDGPIVPANRYRIAENMKHGTALTAFLLARRCVEEQLGLEGREVGPLEADKARAAGFLSPIRDTSVSGIEQRNARMERNASAGMIGGLLGIFAFAASLVSVVCGVVLDPNDAATIFAVCFAISIIGVCSAAVSNRGADSRFAGLSKVGFVLGIASLPVCMATFVPMFLRWS